MWIAVVLWVMTAYADDTFSCAATDEQGNVIHGYYDEEDTQWYLFLTNNVSIPDLDVELRGEVSSTDKGTVDQQTNAQCLCRKWRQRYIAACRRRNRENHSDAVDASEYAN